MDSVHDHPGTHLVEVMYFKDTGKFYTSDTFVLETDHVILGPQELLDKFFSMKSPPGLISWTGFHCVFQGNNVVPHMVHMKERERILCSS